MFYYNIMLVVRAEIDFCILQNPRSNGCQSNTKKESFTLLTTNQMAALWLIGIG